MRGIGRQDLVADRQHVAVVVHRDIDDAGPPERRQVGEQIPAPTIEPTPITRPVPTTTVPMATPLRGALRSAKLTARRPGAPKRRRIAGLRRRSTGPSRPGAASDTPAKNRASATHTATSAA